MAPIEEDPDSKGSVSCGLVVAPILKDTESKGSERVKKKNQIIGVILKLAQTFD